MVQVRGGQQSRLVNIILSGLHPPTSPYPPSLLSADVEKANTNNNNTTMVQEKREKPMMVTIPPTKSTTVESGQLSPSDGSCDSDTIFQV